MAEIIPTLALQCSLCDHRPPADSVMEAFLLHCQVDHDTDDVKMDLRAVCTCGVAMTFVRSRKTSYGFADRFHCSVCGNDGTVRRGPEGEA